jgi:AcrR family transcriptional regulator
MATARKSHGSPADAAAGRLSRERILSAAIQIVEGEGLQALSMRRLAQELDVWPMSVYRYFRDKAELLDAIAEEAASDVELPGRSGSWRQRMRELLGQTRAALSGRPGGLAGRSSDPMLAPGMLRLTEAGIALLREAGFGERDAARAWRVVLGYALGDATLTASDGGGDGRRRALATIAGLPAAEYPVLVAAPEHVADALTDAAGFDWGLDRVLDGLEAGMRNASA